MSTLLVLIALALIGLVLFVVYENAEAERLERLNRESWDVLRAARQIHDETADALQEMFDAARQSAPGRRDHEIKK